MAKAPADVDGVIELVSEPGRLWFFGRSCRALPLPLVREALARFETMHTQASIFVRECARADPKAPVDETWSAALGALLDLESSYAWGSKQRRTKLVRLAADPRFLSACQAVAVGCTEVNLSILAVLAIDASDESIDALMPHFVRACETKGHGLDMLESLRTYARDAKAMNAMLQKVEDMLGARNASSPALDLARRIGLGDLEVFWATGYLGSIRLPPHNEYAFQAHFDIDSRAPVWFRASISHQRDALGVGTCEADDLPEWLASLATTRGFAWNFGGMGFRTGLRGKKRGRFLAWLAGEP